MEKNVLLPPVLVNKEFPFFLSLSLLTISQMNKINMKHPEFWCVCEREREGKRQRERQYRKNRKLRLWPQLCVSKAEWQCFVDPNTKSLSLPLYWFSVERGCVATKHYMCYWKLKWSCQRTDRTVVYLSVSSQYSLCLLNTDNAQKEIKDLSLFFSTFSFIHFPSKL